MYSLIMRICPLEQHGFTQQRAYCYLLIFMMRISEYVLQMIGNKILLLLHPRLTLQIGRVMEFNKLFRDYDGHMTCEAV